jgi:hypothetical protein
MTDSLPEPPELDPAALAASTFGRARKGLDPAEVNAALGRAADALRVWELRDRQLRARLEDLERQVSESHEVDEHRIASVLGEETARIVTAAKDAAAEIRSKAEDQAARLLRETEESATSAADALKAEAAELREQAEAARAASEAEAEQRRADAAAAAEVLEADARRRHDELIAEAAGVLDLRTREAESVASGLVEAAAAELSAAEVEAAGIRIAAEVAANEERDRAREEGRTMVAEAKALRERMLADLAERRRTARRQIEGARAGRDRIVEVLRAAGADVAATIDGLEDIDGEIQRAADAAALQVDDDIDAVVAELEAELSTPSIETPDGQEGEPSVEAPVDEVPATPMVVLDIEIDEPVGSPAPADEHADVGAAESVGADANAAEPDEAGAGASESEPAAVGDDVGEQALAAPAGGADEATGTGEEHEIELVETVDVVETLTVVEDADGIAVVDVVEVTDVLDAVDTSTGESVELAAETRVDAEVIGMFRNGRSTEESADVVAAGDQPSTEDLEGADELDDLDDDDLDDAEDATGATVHDLFARIRAEGLDEDESVDDTEVVDLSDGGQEAPDQVVPGLSAAEQVETGSSAAGQAEAVPVEAAAAVGVTDIGELLDQRDRALVPIEKQLSRSLRRLASDEQNEVLDQLRRLKRARPDVATVLSDPEATRTRFVDALLADFGAAVEAGSTFWSEVAGSSADTLFDDEDRTRNVLSSQLDEFLAVHRAHLERTFAEADEQGMDASDLGDSIRAAYRDLRSSSLAELAGDLATAGFAHGERVAAGPGTPWRWVVDNGGLPCADGEDNALAGDVACEEPFPTGDITPPAHPGCRCMLLPAHR